MASKHQHYIVTIFIKALARSGHFDGIEEKVELNIYLTVLLPIGQEGTNTRWRPESRGDHKNTTDIIP